jgi:hypothetical protein
MAFLEHAREKQVFEHIPVVHSSVPHTQGVGMRGREPTDGSDDAQFEDLLKAISSLPPTLLWGLFRHVVRMLYHRGVFGRTDRPTDRISTGKGKGIATPLDPETVIDGGVSKAVRTMERELREEMREKQDHAMQGGRHLDMTPLRVAL